jgi:plastocyanin
VFPLTGSHAGEGEQEPAVTIQANDQLDFDPAEVTITVGETIRWNNPGSIVHTVTADPEKALDPEHVKLPENAEPWDSGDLAPGEDFTRTFTVPGHYRYFCIPHESAGMIGEIIVKPAE